MKRLIHFQGGNERRIYVYGFVEKHFNLFKCTKATVMYFNASERSGMKNLFVFFHGMEI